MNFFKINTKHKKTNTKSNLYKSKININKMIKKYIKVNVASPKKILKWTERSLPNGEEVGKITKAKRFR